MAKNLMFLYGKNSILERLKANPKSISKILIQDSFEAPQIEKLIKQNNITVERVSAKELTRVKHAKDLQGIVAKVDKFKYVPFDELLSSSVAEKRDLIFLDRINDPQNLGVIMRTAACFGNFAVIIPRFSACEVTEAVLHVASGGENHLPVSLVSNLTTATIAAKKSGYWIMGAVLGSDAEDVARISLPFPLGLVLGSEGGGIREGLKKQLDIRARIPMRGAQLTFNVAVAGAIFCHQIAKQRGAAK